MISTNVAISHADNSVTCSHEKVGARAVVIPPSLGIVHVPFQFENDSLRKTAEVHYEAMQDVLTPELQVEDPTIAEQGPRVALSGCTVAAQFASERVSLRG